MNQVQTKIGTRIAKLRHDQNLSQNNLAHSMGKDGSWLARIERGRTNPTLKTLTEIADALEVDLQELFSGLD